MIEKQHEPHPLQKLSDELKKGFEALEDEVRLDMAFRRAERRRILREYRRGMPKRK